MQSRSSRHLSPKTAARATVGRMLRRFGAAAVTALLLSGAVWAQTPSEADVRAESGRIFRSVMSPYCPGLTLAACPSTQAFELRDEIRERMASGESADEIREALTTRFGQNILGNPSNTPTGRVFLGVVAGLAIAAVVGVAMFVRRGMRRDAAEQLPADQIDSTLNARIDDELADA